MRWLILVGISLLVGFPQTAHADASLSCVDLDTGMNANDSNVNPTDSILCNASAAGTNAGLVKIIISDPFGEVLDHVGVISGDGSIPPLQFTPNSLSRDGMSANPGTWTVEYKFYQNDFLVGDLVADLNISFTVLPESALGTIVLVSSSLAALGVFVSWNKRRI